MHIYIYMCVCVCGVKPCSQGIHIVVLIHFQAVESATFHLNPSLFIFKAGGASSPSSLAPTKTLDECWWYLTWSVRRACLDIIPFFDFRFQWINHSGNRAQLIFNIFEYNGLFTSNFKEQAREVSLVNRHSVLQVCYRQRFRHGPVVILVEPGTWVTTSETDQ